MLPVAQSKSEEKPRLHFLDGLRGWGSLIVVFYHVFVEIYPVSPSIGQAMVHTFLFNGGLAIFVFFIVSGYALSAGFLRSGDRRVLERIFVGRYLRLIVPILLGCLIVYLFAKVGLLQEPLRRDSASNFLTVVKFAMFGVFSGGPAITSPIPQLWTMPFEAVGSAMVLSLLWFVGSFRVRFLIYAALFTWLLSRPMYAAFLVGILFAEFNNLTIRPQSRYRISLMATALLGPSLLLVAMLPGRSESVLLGVSAAVAACAVLSEPAKVFLSNGVSSFLGKVSFPLYILHGVITFSFGTWLQRITADAGSILLANLLIVAAAILFAWVCRWIDTAGIVASHNVSRCLLFARQKVVNIR